MSRSNPNETLSNPCQIFYNWGGDEGCFSFYDKVEKKKVTVPVSAKKPFVFIPLCTLSTIKGYSDSDESGFWSNEVKDLKKERLTVRVKSGIVAVGTYDEIKEKIASKGAKFCQSVYVGIKNEQGVLELANIQMYGAALSAWIEFCKGKKIDEIAVAVKGSTEGKKGKTVYQIPTFEVIKVKDETNEAAIELDKGLQVYLKEYLAKNASATVEQPKEEEALPTVHQQKQQESRSTTKKEEPKEEIVFNPSLDEEDSLPF